MTAALVALAVAGWATAVGVGLSLVRIGRNADQRDGTGDEATNHHQDDEGAKRVIVASYGTDARTYADVTDDDTPPDPNRQRVYTDPDVDWRSLTP